MENDTDNGRLTEQPRGRSWRPSSLPCTRYSLSASPSVASRLLFPVPDSAHTTIGRWLVMGAGQSTASTQNPPRALHVLRVTPSSPASETTIEPYFDFVVGYKGDSLASNNSIDASELERIVEGHEGRTLNLLVWNSKSQETRSTSHASSSYSWAACELDSACCHSCPHCPLARLVVPSCEHTRPPRARGGT